MPPLYSANCGYIVPKRELVAIFVIRHVYFLHNLIIHFFKIDGKRYEVQLNGEFCSFSEI